MGPLVSATQQQRICLLTELYRLQLDTDLKVNRSYNKFLVGDPPELPPVLDATKLRLSDQEAEILTSLGESPYLQRPATHAIVALLEAGEV